MRLTCICGHEDHEHADDKGRCRKLDGCERFEFDPSAEARRIDATTKNDPRGDYEGFLDEPDWR